MTDKKTEAVEELQLEDVEILDDDPRFQDLEETDWGSVKITRKNEIRYGIVIVTDDYTVRTNDRYVLVNQSSGTKTVTLPLGRIGKVFTVKAQTANQVDVTSTESIDGAGTKSITSQYDKITVVFDGTTWNIV